MLSGSPSITSKDHLLLLLLLLLLLASHFQDVVGLRFTLPTDGDHPKTKKHVIYLGTAGDLSPDVGRSHSSSISSRRRGLTAVVLVVVEVSQWRYQGVRVAASHPLELFLTRTSSKGPAL